MKWKGFLKHLLGLGFRASPIPMPAGIAQGCAPWPARAPTGKGNWGTASGDGDPCTEVSKMCRDLKKDTFFFFNAFCLLVFKPSGSAFLSFCAQPRWIEAYFKAKRKVGITERLPSPLALWGKKGKKWVLASSVHWKHCSEKGVQLLNRSPATPKKKKLAQNGEKTSYKCI